MHTTVPRIFFYVITVVLIMMLFNQNVYYSQGKSSTATPKWTNLKYSIFFTHDDLEKLLSDSVQFKKTISYFAPLKINKVYLEGRGRGEENVQLMKKVSDRFHKIGIETAGAMVPTADRGGPMCYNNLEDMAMLETRMRALASVFDYIILDDWLFTICTCEKCLEERGDMSWADYRTMLILKQSKKYIIDPAKEVNPKVNVIIKYPNWYEGHRLNGYDVLNETILYDKMAVGIETREPEKQDQHIPVYSGYIFQKWWPGVDNSKWVASWLDNYGMKGAFNEYNAQVWQAVFAQTPEIILWCAGQLYPTNPSSDIYPQFTKMLPEFDKVAGLIKGDSRGVPIYLPYGSTGEYNIFGYLGNMGIPLTPVATFPTESQNAIFTLHSLQDNKLTEKMIDRLKNGKDVFLTLGLFQKLQDSEFKNTFSILPHEGSITSTKFRIREGWNDHIVKSDRPMTFQRIATTTWPYVRDVAVVEEDYDFAVLMRTEYMKGSIYILNIPDNYFDLLKLPEDAIGMVRRAFHKELGYSLVGPGNITSYLYGKNQYALYNMNDKPATVTLRFTDKVPTKGWTEIVNHKTVSVKQDTSFVKFEGPVITDITVTLDPYKVQIIQAP